MMRLRRRHDSRQAKPSEHRQSEAQSEAGPDASAPRDVPISVWVPTLEETSPHEPTDQPERIPEPVKRAQSGWMTIAQGARTEAQRADQNVGGARGEWLPSDLKPEANPLATGTWLRQDQSEDPGPAEAASTPDPQEPSATATTPKAELEPSEADERAAYGQRTRAAVAYCRELFPPDDASSRANQILSLLSGGISDERVLLELLRTSAAELLDRSSGKIRGAEETPACEAVFGRLAARANGTLDAGERSQLEQHLAICVICKAAELRAARADRTFAAILGLAVDG